MVSHLRVQYRQVLIDARPAFASLTMGQIESRQADEAGFYILGEVVEIPKELRPFAGELAVRFLAQSQNEGEMV